MSLLTRNLAGYALAAAVGAGGGAASVDPIPVNERVQSGLSQGAAQAVLDRGEARSQPAILGSQILTIVRDVREDTPAGETIATGDIGAILLSRVDDKDFIALTGRTADLLTNAITAAGVSATERVPTEDVLAALEDAASVHVPAPEPEMSESERMAVAVSPRSVAGEIGPSLVAPDVRIATLREMLTEVRRKAADATLPEAERARKAAEAERLIVELDELEAAQ